MAERRIFCSSKSCYAHKGRDPCTHKNVSYEPLRYVCFGLSIAVMWQFVDILFMQGFYGGQGAILLYIGGMQ
jgi:hypothetical protein